MRCDALRFYTFTVHNFKAPQHHKQTVIVISLISSQKTKLFIERTLTAFRWRLSSSGKRECYSHSSLRIFSHGNKSFMEILLVHNKELRRTKRRQRSEGYWLCAGYKASNPAKGSTPALKPRENASRSPKRGASLVQQNV